MKYRVLYQPNAERELEHAIHWSFANFPPDAAKAWCGKLLLAVESLDTNPERCPIARESEHFKSTIRQLLFGKGKSRYRFLFTVDAKTVRILHVRFPGQPFFNG